MSKTKKITFIGVLSALAIVLYFLEIPLFFYFPPWLKIDLSDIPAVLGAVAAGPVAGIAIELIKNIIHFILRGGTPFASGEIANFFAGIGFLIPVALLIRKNFKNSFIAYILGAVLMVLIANIMNYFITLPLFGWPADQRLSTIMTILVPFNLLKAFVISIATTVLYTSLKRFIKKLQE